MTAAEKQLYHQIHPLKLATDWITGFIALYYFWQHQLAWGLVIAFIPSIIATILIIRYINLESYRQSRFGRYIQRSMSRVVEFIRLAGYLVMVFGAWFHIAWLILAGLTVIIAAWLNGVFIKNKEA